MMSNIVHLSKADIEQQYSLQDAIAALTKAFLNYQSDDFILPQRSLIKLPDQYAFLGCMPVYSKADHLYAVKTATLFPQRDPGTSSVQGLVALFETQQGRLLALLDAAQVTGLRTAATAALVTDILADKAATTLAIIGAGEQARWQFAAMCAVRRIKKLYVYAPTRKNLDFFLEYVQALAGSAIETIVANSVSEAVHHADIICTATTSVQPLFSIIEIKPKVHINAIGAHNLSSREVPIEILQQALVVVEFRDAAVAEAGEQHKHALQIDELLKKPVVSATMPYSLFASVGSSIQDLFVARDIYFSHLSKSQAALLA